MSIHHTRSNNHKFDIVHINSLKMTMKVLTKRFRFGEEKKCKIKIHKAINVTFVREHNCSMTS